MTTPELTQRVDVASVTCSEVHPSTAPVGEDASSTALETLHAEVLRLSHADRAKLLDRLIASLDGDPEAEVMWDALTESRDQDLRKGTAAGVPCEVVVARLKARFPG